MNLRPPDEVLAIGDVAVHGEEEYPSGELVGAGAASLADEAQAPSSALADGKVPEKATQAPEEASHRTRAACGRGVTDERALGSAPGALIAA